MSEERETILRFVQDATGRVIDVKIDQAAIPEPKYVFEVTTTRDGMKEMNGDGTQFVTGTVMSYKTVGDDETVIPVPFTANGETVTPGADGEGRFAVTFETADVEPDPEHPGVYEFVLRLVQEESGKSEGLPYTLKLAPYLSVPGKPFTMSYAGGEKTIDVVLKNALYKDLVVGETPEWLHASMVGKQLRVTCDKNFTVKERSGVVTLSYSDDTTTRMETVMITQKGAAVKYLVRTSCTDGGLSDDKSRRLVRLRITVTCAEQNTGKIIDPDVPWTVTGSDERVVVESVDEAKRELLLSTDAADTLEEPVTVKLHLEDGSDMDMEIPLFKENLTPSEK